MGHLALRRRATPLPPRSTPFQVPSLRTLAANAPRSLGVSSGFYLFNAPLKAYFEEQARLAAAASGDSTSSSGSSSSGGSSGANGGSSGSAGPAAKA